jgi:hypothetical protein
METTEKPNLRSGDNEEARRAAAVLGSSRSEKKQEAARENLLKARRTFAERGQAPGREPRPIESFECTCGRGDTLEGHPTTCPRGLTIYRRRKQGKL